MITETQPPCLMCWNDRYIENPTDDQYDQIERYLMTPKIERDSKLVIAYRGS